MTKKERQKFDEWAVGTIYKEASGQNVDYPESGEEIADVATIPRVIVLKALGYSIETYEDYASAEIMEMNK